MRFISNLARTLNKLDIIDENIHIGFMEEMQLYFWYMEYGEEWKDKVTCDN